MSPDDVVGAATAEASPQAPVLRTEGPLELVEWSAIGELLGGEYAAAYLNTRRWSGARAATLRNVRAECVIALPHEPRAAVAVVVAEAGVATVRYQLPLVRLPHPAPPAAGAPLALVVSGAGEEGIYDGALAPAFHRALRALIVEGGRAGGPSAELRGEALAPATDLPDDASSAAIGGEQSNTSIVYGDGSIIKLFRRVEVGDNPDVEIGRVLAARSDASTVPRLLGTLRYVDAGGGVATLAMRQQLVAGARDAWAYTLDTARHDTDSARAGAHHTAYTADAERLGAVTRRLHESLAAPTVAPEFAPEPATAADVARWAAAAERSISEGLDLLERQLARGAVRGALADEAANMVAWRDAFVARAADAITVVGDDAGQRIRHHGDYHLGQVLRAENGDFFVIDFEGEPLRPLAERRAKHSALRDVAGMLRSFAYAAATVAGERGGAAEPGHAPDARAAAWEEQARLAFLRGYAGAPGRPAAFLPSAADRAAALVALFETEKLFYELAYELQNRPDWAWIPLLGLAQLLGRS